MVARGLARPFVEGDGLTDAQVIEGAGEALRAAGKVRAVAVGLQPGADAGVVEPGAQAAGHADGGVAPLGLHGEPGAPGGDVAGPQRKRGRRGGRGARADKAQAEGGGSGVEVFAWLGRVVGIIVGIWVELTARPQAGQLLEFFRRPASPSLAMMAF